MARSVHCVLLLLSVDLAVIAPGLAFHEGEFVTTARKSQYQGMRSEWHDMLGSHCPRFGIDRTVALPLPRPHVPLIQSKDTYKIQLSFDGDRHITPWVKIMGPGAPTVPVLQVELRHAGEELLGVSTKIMHAPVSYQHAHAQLVEEFKNESHWPKHLLIQYRFHSEHEVDLDRGLYLLMPLGLAVLMVLIVNAASGAQGKLAKFLQEVTGDDPTAAAAASGGPPVPAVVLKGPAAKGD